VVALVLLGLASEVVLGQMAIAQSAEVLLELAARAIEESGASPDEPIQYEGWEGVVARMQGRPAAP
jgi:hypothetical protein